MAAAFSFDVINYICRQDAGGTKQGWQDTGGIEGVGFAHLLEKYYET
jgi:hypothetical protein